MLIQRRNNELLIVRQTDHMAQVARIAEQWGNQRFTAPEHREETIRAAALHDNGWRHWEDQPTLLPQTGRPRNLGDIPPDVHAAFYQAGVNSTIAVDPYSGLLVSMHATVLYAGVEGWDLPSLTPPDTADLVEAQRIFITGQVLLQQDLRATLAATPRYAAAVTPARLWQAYLRLRAWDRLSLYFLFFGMGEGTLDHVPTVEGEETVMLRQIGQQQATAEPWPFDRATVHFPVVVARVPDRRYRDGDEFPKVLSAASQEVWTYTMVAP